MDELASETHEVDNRELDLVVSSDCRIESGRGDGCTNGVDISRKSIFRTLSIAPRVIAVKSPNGVSPDRANAAVPDLFLADRAPRDEPGMDAIAIVWRAEEPRPLLRLIS